MLVIALHYGAETTLTNSETGEVIKLCLARGGDSPRVGIEASLKWDILRSNAKKKHTQPIQSNESDVADLGRRPA